MNIIQFIGRNIKMKSQLFSKTIVPKCEYCQFGKKAKEGNKILCEKQGLVNSDYSCSKFEYSPFKRVPIKQIEKDIDEDDSI